MTIDVVFDLSLSMSLSILRCFVSLKGGGGAKGVVVVVVVVVVQAVVVEIKGPINLRSIRY